MYTYDTDMSSSHELVFVCLFFSSVDAESILIAYHPISSVHLSHVSLGAGRF